MWLLLLSSGWGLAEKNYGSYWKYYNIYCFHIFKMYMDGIVWPHYTTNNKDYRKEKSLDIEGRLVVAWGWGWV